MNKVITTLILFGLLLTSFSFAQKPITPPETLEEAKEMGEKAFEVTKKELPGILEKTWKEEVLPIWQKMWDWFKINVWLEIESWFKKEVKPRAKEEIKKRKPIIEEEFKKEKEELKKELPKVGKSLWEKLKELIK